MAEKDVAATGTSERTRSPGFPIIPLHDAIAKADVFYKADKGAAATTETLAHHWGSSIKSSAFLQWVASLKKFGLLEEVDGGGRQLKLTRLAQDIVLLPDGEPKRAAAIKRAALSPKAFRELWDAHGTSLPSDHNLRHQLVTASGYKPDSAADLIRQYKRTVVFAKLTDADKDGEHGETAVDPARPSGNAVLNGGGGTPPAAQPSAAPSVGDFVQWESQGVVQFQTPRRVTGVTPDGTYVFVEDAKTGLPVEEVRVEKRASEAPMTTASASNPDANVMQPPPNPDYKPSATSQVMQSRPGTKQEVFVTDSGQVVIQWPDAITPEDYADIDDWLGILKRKIKRAVQPPPGVDPAT